MGEAQFAYILSVDVGWPDMTWMDAKLKCQEHGLSFASILSADDQTRIKYKLKGFQTAKNDGIYTGNADPNCGSGSIDDWPCGLWMGANDREVEGDWRWASGLLISDFGYGGFDAATGQVRGQTPWGSMANGASSDEPCAALATPSWSRCGRRAEP